MGYIRDVTGNYDYALWMVGIALIAGGILGISIAQKVAINKLIVVQEAK
jgi:hypothetical protein